VPFDDEVLTSSSISRKPTMTPCRIYTGRKRAREYEETYMTHYSGEAAALREFMKQLRKFRAKTSVHINGFNVAAFKKPSYSFVTQHNILKAMSVKKAEIRCLGTGRKIPGLMIPCSMAFMKRLRRKLMPLFSGLMTR
jgi:hypothetical protein